VNIFQGEGRADGGRFVVNNNNNLSLSKIR
jgi:hypothetical protein